MIVSTIGANITTARIRSMVLEGESASFSKPIKTINTDNKREGIKTNNTTFSRYINLLPFMLPINAGQTSF